jgi:hypothetical protein
MPEMNWIERTFVAVAAIALLVLVVAVAALVIL